VTVDHAAVASNPLLLAGLDWTPAPYLAAPELQPIRATVDQQCPDSRGYSLAVCLSDLFARRFPHGEPSREFFDRRYDPVAAFHSHLAGESGHCVSRSGMLALALLATGTPARVVQILGRDGARGHNVAEIWDAGRWRVLDPSFAGRLESADGSTSAIDMMSAPFPHWRQSPARVKVAGVNQAEALREYEEDRLRGALIVYPEPWLYTRVGQPAASWPFHGRFIVVGSRTLQVGLGQLLLQIGILLSGLAALALAGQLGLDLWRASAPSFKRSRKTAIRAGTETG
jgi:hypothetical protein